MWRVFSSVGGGGGASMGECSLMWEGAPNVRRVCPSVGRCSPV